MSANRFVRQLGWSATVTDSPRDIPDNDVSGQLLPAKDWYPILYERYRVEHVLFMKDEGNMTVIFTDGQSTELKVWEKGSRAAVTICSSKVDEALPEWKDRIVRMHRPQSPGHRYVVELAEGTPLAFRHFLNAAHYTREQKWIGARLRGLSLNEARDLAQLSHQYNALHLIVAEVPELINKFFPADWKLSDPEKYCGQLEYLWIAYEFGVDKIFHQICFNLAFVTKIVLKNPSSMPPGAFEEQIYKLRQAYVEWSLYRLVDYREKLREYVDSEAGICDSICNHPIRTKHDCLVNQLGYLNDVMIDEDLDYDWDCTLWNRACIIEGRSPLKIFKSTSWMNDRDYWDDSYEPNGWGNPNGNNRLCGFGRLKAELTTGDRMMRLFNWMAETGVKPQIATEEQIAYMRGQREKLAM